MKPLILLLILGTLLSAQNVDEILQRYFAAQKTNGERANQYTFAEEDTHFTYDKAGVAKQTSKETYDVIFVEGEEYKKLVSRNGQPLSARDQAKEEKKLQDVAKERRKQRRSGLFNRTFSLLSSDEESTTLFDRHLLGEEEVHGRMAWVVELVPRTDRKPANAHEKDALSSRRKIWVDQAESAPLRWESVVIDDKTIMKPGTKFSIEYVKINEDAWLPMSLTMDLHVQIMKFMKENARQENKFSNYQKFDVQSTITVDPAQ